MSLSLACAVLAQPLVLSLLSFPSLASTAEITDPRLLFWLRNAHVDIGNITVGKRLAVPDEYEAAPYYPAPYGGWVSDWSDSYAKAEELVAKMTLAEKTNITCGTGYFMGNTYSSPAASRGY